MTRAARAHPGRADRVRHRQRWYGSKGREVAGAGVVDQRRAARPDSRAGRDRLPGGDARGLPAGRRRDARRPGGARGRARARPPDPDRQAAADRRRRDRRLRARRGVRRPRLGADRGAAARRRAVEQLGRLRRRALPEGLPPPRAGDEPGAGDAPLPHRARLREHSAARRVVRVRRPAAGGDARDPPGVRPERDRRLGAGPRRAGRGARSLPRAPPPARRGDRLDARGARLRRDRPELLPGDAEPRGARPADRERGRGDRAALPLAAGRPARARADHGPRRGDPRPPAPARPTPARPGRRSATTATSTSARRSRPKTGTG